MPITAVPVFGTLFHLSLEAYQDGGFDDFGVVDNATLLAALPYNSPIFGALKTALSTPVANQAAARALLDEGHIVARIHPRTSKRWGLDADSVGGKLALVLWCHWKNGKCHAVIRLQYRHTKVR